MRPVPSEARKSAEMLGSRGSRERHEPDWRQRGRQVSRASKMCGSTCARRSPVCSRVEAGLGQAVLERSTAPRHSPPSAPRQRRRTSGAASHRAAIPGGYMAGAPIAKTAGPALRRRRCRRTCHQLPEQRPAVADQPRVLRSVRCGGRNL